MLVYNMGLEIVALPSHMTCISTETTWHKFILGKNPAEARLFHEDYLMSYGVEMLADSSVNPPEKWVYQLHDKWRKATFGDSTTTHSFLQ